MILLRIAKPPLAVGGSCIENADGELSKPLWLRVNDLEGQ